MPATAAVIVLMERCYAANGNSAWPQAFQRLVNHKDTECTDQQCADFLHVPTAGAEIARGEVKSNGQHKDEQNGAEALHQATEKWYDARGKLALFIGGEIGRDDEFTVSRADRVQNAVEERARKEPQS